MSTYKALRKNPSAPQVSEVLIAALREIPVAALSDNMHRNIGTVGLRPYHRPGKHTMAGTAVTARSRGGDNLTYLRALEFCRPGDVLVIDAGGHIDNAVVGGILSFYAASIGVAGLVIDGAIRDVAEIREREFPVYARGVTHRGPYKDGPGEINVPVSVGGMVINPGDIVVGDQDGLLAIPPGEAEVVLRRAHDARERSQHHPRDEGGPLGPLVHRRAGSALQQLMPGVGWARSLRGRLLALAHALNALLPRAPSRRGLQHERQAGLSAGEYPAERKVPPSVSPARPGRPAERPARDARWSPLSEGAGGAVGSAAG